MADQATRVRNALKPRYEILDVAGRGGMATVYRARDTRYDRIVAVKVLNDVLCAMCDTPAAERFLREIGITARLQHPHILPLLDSGSTKRLIWAVMPFVEGETLRAHLQKGGALPVPEALLIAREAAEALDHAHRRGVVHRDIKPENLLLSDGHAVVADFGIARALGVAGAHQLTGQGATLGTLAYMSPEQAAGDADIGPASDVYSLGCVLYEMVTGQMAFGGATISEVVARQQAGRPTPIAALRPEVPPGVIACVERAMARSPGDRFASAAEMAERLRALLGEPARDPLTRTPSGEFPGRPAGRGNGTRWLVGAAAAALVALGATTMWTRRAHAPAAGDTDAAGPVAATETGALSMSDASVAVLPLSVRGTSTEDRYLGEGLTEEIIAQLAQVPGLKVISRTSVVALRDARLTTPQIAETLGVRHVLEGSLQRAGRMVQTRVQLVDARTDATIWQHEFESPDSNLFQLQDTVARQVATALVARVTGGRRDSGGMAAAMTSAVTSMGGRAGTNRPAAYQAYLRGHYWLDRPTPEGLGNAIAAFGEATRLDSAYADAWAGLSAAHTSRVIYGYPGREDPYTELARGLLLAERAVALDSASPHAWHALGDAHFTGGWPDSVVRRDMLRSVRAQAPGHEGSMALAFVVGREGRGDSAVAMARRALARDPLSQAAQHSLLVLAIQGRRHDVARAQAARLVRASPKDPVTLTLAAYAALFAGDTRWCAEHAPPGAAVRASCLHTLGRRAEAAAVADSITRQLEGERYQLIHQFLDLAGYHAWTGDPAGAVRWLERSAAHSPVLQRWLLDAELFDPVRQSPVFREGLARVELGIRERIQARAAMLARTNTLTETP